MIINLIKGRPMRNMVFRKNENEYLHVFLDLESNPEKIDVVVFKSADGKTLQFPVFNEPVINSLPPLPNNINKATRIISTHFVNKGLELVIPEINLE